MEAALSKSGFCQEVNGASLAFSPVLVSFVCLAVTLIVAASFSFREVRRPLSARRVFAPFF